MLGFVFSFVRQVACVTAIAGLFSIPFAFVSTSASTMTSATTACKYVDAAGKTVFEKQCLVYSGSLTAINGVRDCNWGIFDVYFTAKARATIWISEDGGNCTPKVNGIPAKVEYHPHENYNYIFLTNEGELYFLNSEGLD